MRTDYSPALLVCVGLCSYKEPTPKPHVYVDARGKYDLNNRLVCVEVWYKCGGCGRSRKWGCEEAGVGRTLLNARAS